MFLVQIDQFSDGIRKKKTEFYLKYEIFIKIKTLLQFCERSEIKNKKSIYSLYIYLLILYTVKKAMMQIYKIKIFI